MLQIYNLQQQIKAIKNTAIKVAKTAIDGNNVMIDSTPIRTTGSDLTVEINLVTLAEALEVEIQNGKIYYKTLLNMCQEAQEALISATNEISMPSFTNSMDVGGDILECAMDTIQIATMQTPHGVQSGKGAFALTKDEAVEYNHYVLMFLQNIAPQHIDLIIRNNVHPTHRTNISIFASGSETYAIINDSTLVVENELFHYLDEILQ